MERRLYQQVYRHLAAFFIVFSLLCSSFSHATETNIHPAQNIGSLQRQVIDANFVRPDKIDRLIVYVDPDHFGEDAYEYGVSFSDDIDAWAEKKEEDTLIFKGSDERWAVRYQNKQILSSEDVQFDYIQLSKVCRGPDQRHRLLFRMVVGGTANGELEDMLFVYYDPINQRFQHQVIAKRYLDPLCNMEGVAAKKQQAEQRKRKLELIFEQLRPTVESTDLEPYVQSGQVLPTRQISYNQFERLLDEARYLMSSENSQMDVDDSEEEVDYFEPKFVFNDLDENKYWRIVEFKYLELWASWGVLLVENSETDQMTSFYNIPPGDSKMHLNLSGDIELVGDVLRGAFNPYSDHRVEISLDDFIVEKAHEYRFSDYPVESMYTGPIAKLDTESSDAAKIFPTALRRQLDEGVNFAGHYALMMAGCGTECQVIVITDVISGKVIAELNARRGVEYRADSELLILNQDSIYFERDPFDLTLYQIVSGKLVRLN